MPITQSSEELIKKIVKENNNPEDIFGKEGIFNQLKKRLIEEVMKAELSQHLGYDKYEKREENETNSRNGKSIKKIRTEGGKLEIEVPRDREGNYEPQIIAKHDREFRGFDDKIVAMYARGMSVREIQGYLAEIYQIQVSPELISRATEEVIEDVKQWQNRALEKTYPIVYLDAIVVKIKENGHVQNKAVYGALAVTIEGQKEVLGLWVSSNEGSKFWMQIMTELKNRGVQDILIACVDGLTGFAEAIESIFPKTQVQLCIVHVVRNSLKYVPYQDRKAVANDLKNIYNSVNEEEARRQLEFFETRWNLKYPSISKIWRSKWELIIPFLAYPQEIRKVIYTTNAIESLNYTLRKITKTRGFFPNDESALKLIFLGLKNISKRWNAPVRDWKKALNQLSIFFENRIVF